MKKWWLLGLASGLAALLLAGCAAALTPTPTPAPTLTPTAVATPTATPWPADLLFYSDFEDEEIYWDYSPSITKAYVEGGLYHVSLPPFTRGSHLGGILTPDETAIYTDVIVSVSVASLTPLEGSLLGFGCRGSERGSYYLMTDAYGRSVGVEKAISMPEEGRWEMAWLNVRERGEGNPSGEPIRHLDARCVGDTLALYADGRRLIAARDDDLRAGNLYVQTGMSYASISQPVQISLDEVSVRRAEGEEPPPPPEVIAYTDDFSDPESGWFEGEGEGWALHYVPQGGYYMETEGGLVWARKPRPLFPLDYKDFAFEMDWLWAEDNVESTRVSILCRWSNQNFYLMSVKRNGEAKIWRYLSEGEEWTLLADEHFTPSDAVRYHMRAECRGNHLALDVNHQRVAEAEDDSVTSGNVGIRVTSDDSQSIGAVVLQAVTMTLYPQGGIQP